MTRFDAPMVSHGPDADSAAPFCKAPGSEAPGSEAPGSKLLPVAIDVVLPPAGVAGPPPAELPAPEASRGAGDDGVPPESHEAPSDADEAETAKPGAASRAVYRLTWCLTILGFMLVIVSGLPLLVEEIQYRLERGRQRAQVEIATAGLGNMHLSELSRAYQMVSQRVAPSVVHINIVESRGGQAEEDVADGEAEPLRKQRRRFDSGQGSGVVVDVQGFIVTNRHVIEDARQIEVVLSDGRRRPARVVGLDELTDIAVLRVEASGLIPAEWGDSEELDVGALVWAVGSPFGLERSITFGILSAKNRAGVAGTPFQNLMQTDAAVNPGNSCGPLVDTQ